MNIQELEWVKRENIPVKMMVMNNEALGMIRHLQRDYFDCLFAGTTDGCGFASCDFTEVAKAYGIPALRMHCDAVREEAPEFLEGEGPKLCWSMEPLHILRPVWESQSTTSSHMHRKKFMTD